MSVGRSRVFVIEGALAALHLAALRVGPVLGWLALDCPWFI